MDYDKLLSQCKRKPMFITLKELIGVPFSITAEPLKIPREKAKDDVFRLEITVEAMGDWRLDLSPTQFRQLIAYMQDNKLDLNAYLVITGLSLKKLNKKCKESVLTFAQKDIFGRLEENQSAESKQVEVAPSNKESIRDALAEDEKSHNGTVPVGFHKSLEAMLSKAKSPKQLVAVIDEILKAQIRSMWPCTKAYFLDLREKTEIELARQ